MGFGQEFDTLAGYRVIGLPTAGEAHDDKTGQGRRFKKSAAIRLNFREHLQSASAGESARESHERIARRQMNMSGLANRNQGRERVADDWQTQRGKPAMREGGQLEWQWQHRAPRVFSRAEPASQSASGEDGDRKGAVFAVTSDDGRGQGVTRDA